MQANAYQLGKVEVKGKLRIDHGDHASYTFSDEQIRNSRHSGSPGNTPGNLYRSDDRQDIQYDRQIHQDSHQQRADDERERLEGYCRQQNKEGGILLRSSYQIRRCGHLDEHHYQTA